MSVSRKIAVQTDDFDVGAEIAAVSAAMMDAGAVASFVGLCRGEGGAVDGVDLEAYPAMAYLEFDSIINAAAARWTLQAVTVIHRYGRISVGERIVLVAVAARTAKKPLLPRNSSWISSRGMPLSGSATCESGPTLMPWVGWPLDLPTRWRQRGGERAVKKKG
jgi:molybdopterin synthase catalytic subunit